MTGFAEEMTEYPGMGNAWTEGDLVCMGRWVFRGGSDGMGNAWTEGELVCTGRWVFRREATI